MNKSCLIKSHTAGLFSVVNNLITWMEIYPQVNVDWSECLYGPKTFESLFDPFPPLEEPFDTVIVHPDQPYTYKNAGHLYTSGTDWRLRLNKHWQRLSVRKEITDLVTDFCDGWMIRPNLQNTVAILVRADGHAGEQLSDRSQSLESYAHEIERLMADQVYVAASDLETLTWFQARFPVICHPNTRRGLTRSHDFHREVQQYEQDAVICMQEVLIMSQCTTLVHPVSNMATAALYINPQLKSIFLP